MNNDSLLQAAQHSLTMAVFSCHLRDADWLTDRRGAVPLPFFAVSRSSVACCLVMMSPGYRDGHFTAGAVLLLGVQLGFWSLLFSHITFCLPFVVVNCLPRV